MKNNKLNNLGDINFWINSKAYNHIENMHQILFIISRSYNWKTEYPQIKIN